MSGACQIHVLCARGECAKHPERVFASAEPDDQQEPFEDEVCLERMADDLGRSAIVGAVEHDKWLLGEDLEATGPLDGAEPRGQGRPINWEALTNSVEGAD